MITATTASSDQLSLVLSRLSLSHRALLCRLPSFSGLTFTYPDSSHDDPSRKQASYLVNKLGGKWKLSYGEDCEYFILPSRYFEQGGKIELMLKSRREWLNTGMKKEIWELYCTAAREQDSLLSNEFFQIGKCKLISN